MENELLALLNFLICLAGGWVCLCRLGAMQGGKTKLTIRWQYTMWFSLLTCSGFSFAFGHATTFMEVLLAAGIVSHLLIGFSVWRHGPPAYAARPHAAPEPK
jgi:hypothetical protein